MTSRVVLAALAAVVVSEMLIAVSPLPEGPHDDVQKARVLLERARAARGGASRLDAVRAMQFRERDLVTTVLWPDLYRIELLAPFGTVTTIFDGSEVSQAWPVGVPAVPRPDAARARAAARGNVTRYSLMYLTKAAAHDRVTPVAAGRQTWGPVSGEVVRFQPSSGASSAAWSLVLGPDMRPVAVLSPSTPTGGTVTGYALFVLSDYRDVSGVGYPFQTQSYRLNAEGKVSQTLPEKRLEGLVINPPITRAGLLAK